jgi:hypothetical protein
VGNGLVMGEVTPRDLILYKIKGIFLRNNFGNPQLRYPELLQHLTLEDGRFSLQSYNSFVDRLVSLKVLYLPWMSMSIFSRVIPG